MTSYDITTTREARCNDVYSKSKSLHKMYIGLAVSRIVLEHLW